MNALRALKNGFLFRKADLLAAALLYASALLFGTLALLPARAVLHALLDPSPEAAKLPGGDLGVLAEAMMKVPEGSAAAFGIVPILLLLFLPVALFLSAGVYSQAARGGEVRPWADFWSGAARNFWPFLGLVLLNGILFLFVGLLPGLTLAGTSHALEEATDPAWDVRLAWAFAVVGGVWFVAARNGAGLARVRRAVLGPTEGLGPCFLASTKFAFRRFLPLTLLGAAFVAARWAAVWGGGVWLSAGHGSPARTAVTVLLLQAGFFAAALLRVAEARTQAAYYGPVLDAGRAGWPAASGDAAPKTPSAEAEPSEAPAEDTVA
jgi:hypothetical protein